MVLLFLQRAHWYPVTGMLLVCFCRTAIVQELYRSCLFIFWALAITLGATTVKMLVTSVTVKPKVEVASLRAPWNPRSVLCACAVLMASVSSFQEARVAQGPVAGQGMRTGHIRCIALSWPAPELAGVRRPQLQPALKQCGRVLLFCCQSSGEVLCTPVASLSLANVPGSWAPSFLGVDKR